MAAASYSNAEYRKLANGTCKRDKEVMLGRVGAYVQAHNGPKADQKKVFLAAVQAHVLPGIEQLAGELRRLGAPQGEEGKIEALLAALEMAASAHRKGPVPSEAEIVSDFKRSAKLANELGLANCAYEG